jgi:predicted enzyme related to lactoylglutathione lyase
MDLPTGSMVTGVYLTSDSRDQVIAFYKSKFGSDASVMETSDAAIITMKKGEQESVMVTVTANSSEDHGKTKVVIMHTTKTKAS